MTNSIVLHQIDNISVGLDKKDGYLNATKLCIAYNLKHGTNKQPSDWLRSKKAQEYIAYVASIRGITRENLVISKAGNSDESGTWVDPDIADDFAMWLSVEYKFKVSQLLQDWRSGKASKEFPNQITGDVDTNPASAFAAKLQGVVDIVFKNVEPEFRQGIVIEGVCKQHPELRPALEPFKPKMLLEAPLLSPTDIGKLLEERDGIKRSGVAVNKLLIEKGLQVSTGNKKLSYRAIGSGLEFSKVVADTASGHGKTIQSLRWYESVIEML